MTTRPSQPGAAVVKLEGSGQMAVLLRVNDKRVERVRVFSEECALDGGGRGVIWLDSVRPADSVGYLESLVTGQADLEQSNRVTEGAISAIALHADASADAALERLVAPGQPERVRRIVPLWLGNSRGRRGFEVLRRLVKEDPSSEVRKKAVFGLSQSAESGAIPTMIDAARTNDHATVRGEAIFWLAQKAGQKAAAAISERIEQDPDTEVKKRAVFALSQLPKDEGVPLLIKVARTHTNPAVKKQAMFWLGQSRDPRALEFFAEILK
jgi:HEAT repeat protein